MDRDLIERVAKKVCSTNATGEVRLFTLDEACAFAAEIAEECAKVCEAHGEEPQVMIAHTVDIEERTLHSQECGGP